jgi:hypothetical protein
MTGASASVATIRARMKYLLGLEFPSPPYSHKRTIVNKYFNIPIKRFFSMTEKEKARAEAGPFKRSYLSVSSVIWAEIC